jgi:hypothetical protein
MPTEQDIIDRVAAYCVRLEDDLGVPLHRRHLPTTDRASALDNDIGAEALPTEVRPLERARGLRRQGALAAAVVLVAVGIGLLSVLQSRRVDQSPENSITPTASSAATTSSSPAATSPSTTSTDHVASTVPSQPTPTLLAGGVLRPFLDPNLCSPLAVTGGAGTGSTFDLHLFARPTKAVSFPIQIIGDPVGGPTAPFALLQRYPDQVGPGQGPIVKINDWDVALRVFSNGNGDARWALPDGGQGYIRSRGLDRDSLIAIISALTVRDPNAAIPGFDYTPGPGVARGLQLLVEHLNTGVHGRHAGLQCQVAATNFIYRISTLDGDPLFQYAGVIDRPVPLQVGYQQGTLVIIEGNADPTAPTVDDVVNADPTTWSNLPSAPAI